MIAGCSSDPAAPAAPDAPNLQDAAPDATTVVFAPVPVPGTTRVLSQTIQVGGRSIVVFVPAFAYDPRAATLLFLNDGQDVGGLGLAGTLDLLWGASAIGPVVVAALPIVDRLQDYGTAEHDVTIACDEGGQLLGTKAADYGRFVVDEAVPAVKQAVGITPVPARTGFLGASLGGLSAFSIAWDHPEIFGFAGALSGSFWWRTMSGTVEQRQSSRIMPAIVTRSSSGRPGFRAWFEAGTRDETDDRDGDGVIDAIDDTLDLIEAMKGVGFALGPDLVYDQVQDGIHGYPTWSLALPDFLRWAAPAAVN